MIFTIRYNKPWHPVYEGGDDEAAKAAAAAAAEAQAKADAEAAKAASEAEVQAAKEAADAAKKEAEEARKLAEANKDKKFSQEELNRLLADDRRKHKAQTQKAIDELEAIKKKSQMSDEDKAELQLRIDDLNNELLTKEELARKKQKELENEYTSKLTEAQNEKNEWQNRFTKSTITRAITESAVEHKAFGPEQIVAILQPNTQLAEAVDGEGKPTGEMVPKVQFSDTDKDGKPVTLELSVPEAVKRMTEIEKYLNLFQGDSTGGLGANNQPAPKPGDVAALAKDPAKYREARKKGQVTF